MRCVPRQTPIIRPRGNRKSARTGSRQAPLSGFRGARSPLFQECFPRLFPDFTLRSWWRLGGFCTLFFLTRVAGAGDAGSAPPARAGIPEAESKSPASSRRTPRLNVLIVFSPAATRCPRHLTRIMTNSDRFVKGIFARLKKNGRHADRAAHAYPPGRESITNRVRLPASRGLRQAFPNSRALADCTACRALQT
jgi:hypothetical protein